MIWNSDDIQRQAKNAGGAFDTTMDGIGRCTGLGPKIRTLREKAGLTQKALAMNARVSQSTLSYLESGSKSPNINTLSRICDALGMSLADLAMCDTEHPIIPKHLRPLFKEALRLDAKQADLLCRFLATVVTR